MFDDFFFEKMQEISPLTSGRLSHSSGPLNCLTEETESPPISPSDEYEDVVKVNLIILFDYLFLHDIINCNNLTMQYHIICTC